jgi:chromosomal replication initiator protein
VNAKQIWDAALARIEPRFSNKASFDTWFKSISVIRLVDHALVIGVPSTFAKEQVEGRFGDLIRVTLSEVAGAPIILQVVVPGPDEPEAAAHNGAQALDDGHTGALFLEAQPEPAHRSRAANSPSRPPGVGPRTTRRPASERLADAPTAPNLFAVTPNQMSAGAIPPPPDCSDTSRPPAYEQTNKEQRRQLKEFAGPGESSDPDGSQAGGGGMRFPQSAGVPDGHDRDGPPPESTQRLWPANGSEGALNPRYTFGTFIVGKANRLAHAASLAVAESPGGQYNPLFLYGGVGLGKTHLLHAVGHVGEAAGLTVLYVTSERFTNEIINAIRFQKTEEFRAKYRQIDVLLVDDIQFIAGKESTEEEFFHTFNTLHNANKQIVVSSDRPPKAIHSLQDRLRSRFEWGLLADIQPPEYEHRLAILRSKAESLRFAVPPAVIEYIARPECSSVRELEGALNRVIAYAMLNNAPLTLGLAMQALEHLYADGKGRPLNPTEVLEAVARYYNVSLDALKGKQRDREIVWPRQIAMYLMREETSASLLQIGTELGGRDHTTVMHGWDKVNTEISGNDRVRREVAAIRESLRGGTRPM